MSVDLVIHNGTVVTPHERIGPDAGVAVDDEKIVAVGESSALPPGEETIDIDGNALVPGIIDCHVHTRSPGHEFREDWETATRAAAAGGVTSIIGMPNTDPYIDRPEHLRTMFDLIESNALVDAQSYGLVTSDNIQYLEPLADAGVAGFKCFLISGGYYDFDSPDDGELLEAMERIAETGKRIGFHEENAEIVNHTIERFKREGRTRPIDHHRSRPVIAEVEAISRMTLFAEHTGCPVHMFHESSGTGAEAVAEAKARGVDVTAETMPHYLQFTEEAAEEKGNTTRISPPLRTQEEQDGLWEVGVHGDGIDCFATDHSPFTEEEKGMDDPFQNTWDVLSGFVGLETEVPAFLTMVNEGRLSMEKWISMHSARPAEIWDMYPQKGSLRVGTDADMTVVDPESEWTLDRHELHSKNKVTPFDGETFTGEVTMTVVRGEVVYDGEIRASPGYGTVIDVDE